MRAIEEHDGKDALDLFEATTKLIEEKRAKEREQDRADGDPSSDGEEASDSASHLTGSRFQEVIDYLKESRGHHLNEFADDEDVYTEKWSEWVQTQAARHLEGPRPGPDPLEKLEQEWRESDPLHAHLEEQLDGPKVPRSLLAGQFLPDTRGWHQEMDRLEANVGRYPIGFRHYENYLNYNKQFPERTIEDYHHDMNSQISADEYLLLSQKAFVYEATYNPRIVYEFELDALDPDDEADREKRPEVIAQSQAFKEHAL